MQFKCIMIVGTSVTLCVLIAVIIMISFLKPPSNNVNESFKTNQKIPKIIHQTGPDIIPEQFKKSIDKLIRMNPDYEYKFWSNTAVDQYIDENCSKRERNAYKAINPAYGAARGDFFRYIITRDQGGVYLDLKSSVAKPLRKIIKPTDEYLLSCWLNKPHEWWLSAGGLTGAGPNQHSQRGPHDDVLQTGFGEYCNWFIISVPNHPFLDAVIKKCIENIEEYQQYPDADLRKRFDFPSKMIGKLGVLHLTGPIAYTKAIQPLINTAPHTFKYAHYDGDLIYTTTAGKLQRDYLKHADYFIKHYSTLKEPIIL